MTEQLKIFAVELYGNGLDSAYFHIVATNEEDAEAQAREKDGHVRIHADIDELSCLIKGYDISVVKKAEVRMCPSCKDNTLYTESSWNALSRKDSTTEICSECAVAEAFEDELL